MTDAAASLRRVKRVPLPTLLVLVGAAAVLVTIAPIRSARADATKQYEAYMTKYFLSVHRAVPLFSNGSVESLDSIRLSDETNYTDADQCFNGVIFDPLNLPSVEMHTHYSISATVAAQLPAYRLVEVAAQLGGRVMDTTRIVIYPFAQEQQPNSLSMALHPKDLQDCRNLLDPNFMRSWQIVLVAKVFRGRVLGAVELAIDGYVNASGQLVNVAGDIIDEDSVRETLLNVIGALAGSAAPKVNVSIAGTVVNVYITTFPDVQSIAITSAFLNPEKLAQLYFRLRAGPSANLDRLVNEYLYGREPTILQRIGDQIRSILSDLGLLYEGGDEELYASVFSGEGAIPFDVDEAQQVPPEQWRALALVATANVIAESE